MLKHIRMHLEYLKITIKTALEYRVNFIVQSMAMLLSDLTWIIFWVIIFNKFDTIGGWNVYDMMLLYSIVLTSYGISGVIFGNKSKIAETIVQGKLDYYLALPKNTLYHLIASRSSWYNLGDLILGLILAVMFLHPAQILLFIVLVILSAVIVTAFGIIIGSLAFYINNSEETARTLNMSLVTLASYPIDIFKGFTKILVLFVIPAGFVSGVPVSLLKHFDLTWLLYTAGFAILLTTIAIIVFYKGLKRYESGSTITIRI